MTVCAASTARSTTHGRAASTRAPDGFEPLGPSGAHFSDSTDFGAVSGDPESGGGLALSSHCDDAAAATFLETYERDGAQEDFRP
jgi:hypothetical protein